jgi:hypothetical protein
VSDRRSNVFARGEEFLRLFKRGAEFTQELLTENERLRRLLMEFEARQESAARSPHDWNKLRTELVGRIQSLEEQYRTVRERLQDVEEENRHFADRYVEVEEENNALANLYVASYQLHSTLDIAEVLKIIIEIVINLIGAEVFALYLSPSRGSSCRRFRCARWDPVRWARPSHLARRDAGIRRAATISHSPSSAYRSSSRSVRSARSRSIACSSRKTASRPWTTSCSRC